MSKLTSSGIPQGMNQNKKIATEIRKVPKKDKEAKLSDPKLSDWHEKNQTIIQHQV